MKTNYLTNSNNLHRISKRFKFINLFTKSFSSNFSNLKSQHNELHNILSKVDESQKMSFEEKLILVDENDNQISSTSKIDAHLRVAKNKYPHRAFSVFLFDQNDHLLLQQRSAKKITFKNLWSNTCCSHPIDNEDENIIKNNIGIRNAAVRRIKFELGMNTNIDQYFVRERILYRADSDEIFEEFELDYILLAKLSFDLKDVVKTCNPDEVSEMRLISKRDLVSDVQNGKIKITPWFELIVKNKIDEIYEKAKFLNEDTEKCDLKIVSFI